MLTMTPRRCNAAGARRSRWLSTRKCPDDNAAARGATCPAREALGPFLVSAVTERGALLEQLRGVGRPLCHPAAGLGWPWSGRSCKNRVGASSARHADSVGLGVAAPTHRPDVPVASGRGSARRAWRGVAAWGWGGRTARRGGRRFGARSTRSAPPPPGRRRRRGRGGPEGRQRRTRPSAKLGTQRHSDEAAPQHHQHRG